MYAFLAEKERRSGSMRTVQSYSRMLRHFFGTAGKTPDKVTSPEVLAWAHGIGLSGRQPSATTIGARTACLSSFYKFLIRMGMVAGNPCDALERPRITAAPARGYTGDDVHQLLAAVPETLARRRDRAIILALVMTGRGRSEVINLKAGDITTEGAKAFYSYRGKGGKRGRRELPRPAYQALLVTLSEAGKVVAEMKPEESLWQAGAGDRGVTSATFYNRFRRYLKAAGLAFRCSHPAPHGRNSGRWCRSGTEAANERLQLGGNSALDEGRGLRSIRVMKDEVVLEPIGAARLRRRLPQRGPQRVQLGACHLAFHRCRSHRESTNTARLDEFDLHGPSHVGQSGPDAT